jgi:hypothetical protein
VTPFFQSYDDAIEAQATHAEYESSAPESEVSAAASTGHADHIDSEPAQPENRSLAN